MKEMAILKKQKIFTLNFQKILINHDNLLVEKSLKRIEKKAVPKKLI